MAAGPTIALDAMGGDHAPAMVVRGAELARQRHPSIRYRLCGDEGRIAPLLRRQPKLAACAEILHTGEAVDPDERPSAALRRKAGSSMALAVRAVRDGEADAAVSAGNTGALMAFAMTNLKRLPGIRRPAIAAVIPTRRGESVILDLGANVECEAGHLVQFAFMGTAFARIVLGRTDPDVRLLNVGVEDGKGRAAVGEAAEALRAGPLGPHFRGYVEGDAVVDGAADVVVADGFAGNVMLKTAEGTARLCGRYLRTALRGSLGGWVAMLAARQLFQTLREKLDPRRHNGAIFLGLDGIAVKSHGGTDALGFAHSIDVARDMVEGAVNDRILEGLEAIGAPRAEAGGRGAA